MGRQPGDLWEQMVQMKPEDSLLENSLLVPLFVAIQIFNWLDVAHSYPGEWFVIFTVHDLNVNLTPKHSPSWQIRLTITCRYTKSQGKICSPVKVTHTQSFYIGINILMYNRSLSLSLYTHTHTHIHSGALSLCLSVSRKVGRYGWTAS